MTHGATTLGYYDHLGKVATTVQVRLSLARSMCFLVSATPSVSAHHLWTQNAHTFFTPFYDVKCT